ncbi:MAG TPA: type II toxin-antitoxin system RelE/ParE family toxin [Thiobacillus sp.]|nr:type II toxin-antitoxin system RelE/ParE family toxin [Thiobacillus sp.]
MKHVWHPLAETEFDQALDYYAVHAGANISRKFATAAKQTLGLLHEHPAIGKPIQCQARSIPLHGFPFDLVYRIYPGKIVIIAIANQSRRPGYWVGRQ